MLKDGEKIGLDKHPKKEIIESELVRDMEILYDLINNKKRYQDEYIFKFLSDASNLFKTIANDKENFKKDWDKIERKYIAIIAGHTHKAREEFIDEEHHIVVGHKFYERNKCYRKKEKDCNQIVFEIITVKENDTNRDIHLFLEGSGSWWNEQAGEAHKACIKSKLKLE